MEELQALAGDFYWVDIVIGLVVLVYVSFGAVAGWVSSFVRLLMLAVALGFVYLFADVVADQVGKLPLVPEEYSFKAIAGFMLLASLVITRLAARLVDALNAFKMVPSLLGSAMGGLLTFARCLVLLMVASVAVAVALEPGATSAHWERSVLLPYVGTATEKSIELLPQGKKDSLAGELKQVFFNLKTHQPMVPIALARLGRDIVVEKTVAKDDEPEAKAKAKAEVKEISITKDGSEPSKMEETLAGFVNKDKLDLLPEKEEEEGDEQPEKKKRKPSMVKRILRENGHL